MTHKDMSAEEKYASIIRHGGVPPTRPTMSNYWDTVRPTYIENWPKELYSLSIPQVGMRLSQDQALRLGKHINEWGECFYPGGREQMAAEGIPSIRDIEEELRTMVSRFPRPMFVRLGSRSPKDAWTTDPRVDTTQEALARLLDGSERVYEDLVLALQHNYNPYIWLRRWEVIATWGEFRCFQRDGRLEGVSQYDYFAGPHHEIEQDADALLWAIRLFHEKYFQPVCGLRDVVFDVFIKRHPGLSTRDGIPSIGKKPSYQSFTYEVKLIEINPFYEFTDPCLFSWKDGGDFGGVEDFRYRRASQADEVPDA